MPRLRDRDKTQEQLIKEIAELRQRVAGLERAEHVRAKEALRGTEEELKTILDEIRHGIILLDLTGKIISINKRITEISGYTEKDVVGKRFNRLKMFPPQDITAFLTAFAQVISGKTLTVEAEACAKTGEKLIVEIDGTLLKIGGKTERVIAFLKDITARRQAEEALRESEEQLEAIFNEVSDGIVLLDLTGKIIKINKRVAEVTGYAEKYIVGKRFNFFKNFPPQSIAKMIAAFTKTVAGKPVPPFEVIGYTKAGERRIGEIDGSLVRKKGKAERVLVVMEDITERKQAEEALSKSEEKYRTVVELSPDGIAIASKGRHVFANRSLAKIFGVSSPDELLGKPIMDYIHPDYRKIARERIEEQTKRGVFVSLIEEKMLRADGTVIHAEVAAAPLQYEGEQAVLAVIRDITERKQTEEALRESEQKYRTILETMEEGYYEVDLAGNFTFCNEADCRIHGRSRDEMMGLNNREFSSPETAKRVYAIFNQVYRTGIPAKIIDYEVIRKDGSVAMLETSASLLRNAAGEPIGFYGISRDRTEQKKAEEVLRQSEEKYRTILENIEDGYYEVDLSGNLTFLNDSMCRIYGSTRDDMMGMNNREYMDGETAKKTYRLFNQVYRTGEPAEIFDWEFIKEDGGIITVEMSVSLKRDSTGKPIGFRGIIRDITERKQAEEALRESEEKYRSLVEFTEDPVYLINRQKQYLFMNEAYLSRLGLPRDQVIGRRYGEFHSRKEDEEFSEHIEQVFKTGRFVQHEHRSRRDDRYFLRTLSPVKEPDGSIETVTAISKDITERKRAEEELEYMVTHDSLTGLPNRTLFTDRLTMALAQARRSPKMLAVMLLDLDYFKNVNDTLGHSVGDQLLRLVGNRLTEVLRKGDTVARIGGDEFLLLLPAIARIEDATTIAEKILDAFRAAFFFDDHELRITTSIGIAIFPDGGDDVDTLMKNADIAMYCAKDKGRGTYQRYAP